MIVVTDTHSLIWFLTNDKKLSHRAASIFRMVDKNESTAVIPSIVMAETMHICEKKGTLLKFEEVLKIIHESKNYIIHNLDYQILNEIAKYKKLNDIHDRIIVATANLIGAGLITNDSEIKNSSYVKIIW